jgi:enoyl-CoA hydratase/carnithine racemase
METIMEKCTCQIGERGVALITLSNPPMNAFDEEMLLALEETVRRIGVDSACKVAVIRRRHRGHFPGSGHYEPD